MKLEEAQKEYEAGWAIDVLIGEDWHRCKRYSPKDWSYTEDFRYGSKDLEVKYQYLTKHESFKYKEDYEMTTEQKIAKLEQELAELKAERSKSKKFAFDYERNTTWFIGEIYIEGSYNGTSTEYLEHGRYRKTEKGAELSLARNKRGNRLEALVEYLGGLKEFAEGEDNYYIRFYADDWLVESSKYRYNPCQAYMKEEIAIKVCEMLNNGEYELWKNISVR